MSNSKLKAINDDEVEDLKNKYKTLKVQASKVMKELLRDLDKKVQKVSASDDNLILLQEDSFDSSSAVGE